MNKLEETASIVLFEDLLAYFLVHSFLLFVTCKILLEIHIRLTQSCDFAISK